MKKSLIHLLPLFAGAMCGVILLGGVLVPFFNVTAYWYATDILDLPESEANQLIYARERVADGDHPGWIQSVIIFDTALITGTASLFPEIRDRYMGKIVQAFPFLADIQIDTDLMKLSLWNLLRTCITLLQLYVMVFLMFRVKGWIRRKAKKTKDNPDAFDKSFWDQVI